MEPAADHQPLSNGVLPVRGIRVITPEELALLRADIGTEFDASATIRAWLAGDPDVPPHSLAVALEAQLRMLFGTPPGACQLLQELIERLALAFPADVQPLYTD